VKKKTIKKNQDKMIEIKCKGSGLISIDDLEIIQGDLKKISPQNRKKLRHRIETVGFDAPLFVWRGKVLDGTQRLNILRDMLKDGWRLPQGKVPVCDIEARDLAEAKDRLLGYVSQYGDINEKGLFDFLKDIPSIDLDHFDLPDFSLPAFKLTYQELGMEPLSTSPKGKIKPGESNPKVMRHIVICDCRDAKQQEEVFDLLSSKGYDCRVVTEEEKTDAD